MLTNSEKKRARPPPWPFLLRVVVGGLNGHVVLATRTGRRVRRRGPLDGLQTERIGPRPPQLLHGPNLLGCGRHGWLRTAQLLPEHRPEISHEGGVSGRLARDRPVASCGVKSEFSTMARNPRGRRHYRRSAPPK